MASQVKKWIFNIAFFVIIIGLTIYFVLRGSDLSGAWDLLTSANVYWCLVAVLLVILFIISESAIIAYLAHSLKISINFLHCILYSFVGFFFSAITPSASGGQPFQIVFMKRDGISISTSCAILAIVTILYKTVLILVGVLVFIFRPEPLMILIAPHIGWYILGLFLNVIFVSAMVVMVFKPRIIEVPVIAIFDFANKIFKFKKADSKRERLRNGVHKYASVTANFTASWRTLFVAFIMTLIQRFFLFLVTYIAALALYQIHVNMPLVVSVQAMISVAVDMMPMPGGSGLAEFLFQRAFAPLVSRDILLPLLILSRGIGYYTQIILGGIGTLAALVVIRDKGKKEIKE